MPYVDTAYYSGTYLGTLIPLRQRAKALKDASRDIDSLTYNRITAIGFDNLTEFQKNIFTSI